MKFHLCVYFSMITAVILYMVLVMSTAHVYSANILSVKWLKSVKIASFVPILTNGNWPVHLGQNAGKLKNLAVRISYYTIILDSSFQMYSHTCIEPLQIKYCYTIFNVCLMLSVSIRCTLYVIFHVTKMPA